MTGAAGWNQVKAIFDATLERPLEERQAFLRQSCGNDDVLLANVESLLAAHEGTGSFFTRPAIYAVSVSALAGVGGMLEEPSPPLRPGDRLGPDEVTEFLAAGGMGEVYRARDTKLGRDVAIKVLPSSFTSDPDRLARFEREARVLATLNHSHIGAIYGFEEGDGICGLVLELVEGPTLADRLSAVGRARSRTEGLPVDEALAIARQIAEALEAAHEKGIVHRDLKPANIKITPDGIVKVLDFGLAKAAADEPRHAVSHWPSASVGDTEQGLILGTADYMSPEQARGRPVDKRTDIWAFGCVLYEMLAGRSAFTGGTVPDTIAAIIGRDPDWGALPTTLPPHIGRLLHRCLEKDPKRRLHDIADARLEIDEPAALPPDVAGARPAPLLMRRYRLAWGLFTVVSVVALALGVSNVMRGVAPDTRVFRSSILLPENVTMPIPARRLALSPDGRRLAFVAAAQDAVPRIWIRGIEDMTPQPLAGTDGVQYAFWSPNSRFLAFVAHNKLKKIDLSGGAPTTLADAASGYARFDYGGSWGAGDVILFTPRFTPERLSGLYRVSARGGTPLPVTTLDRDTSHWWPSFLPDGRHFLYVVVRGGHPPVQLRGVFVGSLDPAEKPKLLIEEGSNATYAQGHILFLRDGRLMAQPFDVDRLELTGDAVAVASDVATGGTTAMTGAFSVSETGVLVYQTGAHLPRSQLVWLDRQGKQIETLGSEADYGDLELSPDQTRLVVSVRDVASRAPEIWIFDVKRGLRTKLTSGRGNKGPGVWSPDGTRLVYASDAKGDHDLYERASNGTGIEEELLTEELDQHPISWSHDGRYLLYQSPAHRTPATLFPLDLWVLPRFGDRKPMAFLESDAREIQGRISPDGRWVAYSSDESGNQDIYVTSFPKRDQKSLVSVRGGEQPRWRADGKEIFYLAPNNKLMAAAVNGDGLRFTVGSVRPLFDMRAVGIGLRRYTYDVADNGERFLVNRRIEEAVLPPITLVIDWTAGLK